MAGAAAGAPGPAGHYEQARLHGGFVFSAGMTPKDGNGLLGRGLVGGEIPVEQAGRLAATAARRALDAAEHAAEHAGQRVSGVLMLTVYLATGPGFTEHSAVADGASEAVRERFPALPLPARAAVGVSTLPGGSPVEVHLTAAVSQR